MLVPWNDVYADVDVGSWSILSIAVVVKRDFFNGGGQTIPSFLYFSQSLLVMVA